jgi:uncharacterized protein YfaP (DUF2135 family)
VGNGVECCSNLDCAGEKRCVSYFCATIGDPSFSLAWFGDGKSQSSIRSLFPKLISRLSFVSFADDLDLHVVTPGQFEIYYYVKKDPTSGGELDVDKRPLTEAPGDPIRNWVENVNFPLAGRPRGTYTFWVHNYLASGTPDAWELKSYQGENVVAIHTGVVGHDQASENYTLTV